MIVAFRYNGDVCCSNVSNDSSKWLDAASGCPSAPSECSDSKPVGWLIVPALSLFHRCHNFLCGRAGSGCLLIRPLARMADPPILPPMPVNSRLGKDEVVALFRKFEARHGLYCEGVGLEIEVQESGVLEEAVWDALRCFNEPPEPTGEATVVVNQFATSDDVLYCYSRASEDWPQGIDEDWEMAMFQLQIAIAGWSVVSMGEEDCVPVGDAGFFLLVRDQKCEAVRNMAQLMIDAGPDSEDVLWDRWEIPLEPTLFEDRSWRDLVPLVLPRIPANYKEADQSFDWWSDDTPLFDAEDCECGAEDCELAGGKVSNSKHAQFILELFDHCHAMKNNLVDHVYKLQKRHRKLEGNLKSVIWEASAKSTEIDSLIRRVAEVESNHATVVAEREALTCRIAEMEPELADARRLVQAASSDVQPKKRKCDVTP